MSDHLNSTSVLVNQDGTVAARNYYLPYGYDRGGGLSTLTTKRFTGQYHEEARGRPPPGLPPRAGEVTAPAGNDPFIGRFIQADTLIPSPASPQAFNRYCYLAL